jgi:hypothetical protein
MSQTKNKEEAAFLREALLHDPRVKGIDRVRVRALDAGVWQAIMDAAHRAADRFDIAEERDALLRALDDIARGRVSSKARVIDRAKAAIRASSKTPDPAQEIIWSTPVDRSGRVLLKNAGKPEQHEPECKLGSVL